MKLDALTTTLAIEDAGDYAGAVEAKGFHGLWIAETQVDPGPIAQPAIAVYLAAVNEGMFRTAGEVADGIVAHPFSTASYLREIGMPALARGLARAGRERASITVACPVFTLVDASPTLAAD